MAHGHGHLAAHGRSRTGDDTPPWVRWLLVAVVGVIALTAAVGLWLLRPQGTAPKTAEGLGLAPGPQPSSGPCPGDGAATARPLPSGR